MARRDRELQSALMSAHDAAYRVGHDAAAHLAWIQEFAYRPFTDARALQQANNEVLHFCQHWHHHRYAERSSSMTMMGFGPELSAATLQPIARRMVHYLCSRKAGALDWLRFDPVPIRFSLWWTPPNRPGVSTEGGTPEAHFIAALVSLIEAAGDRLRRCRAPSCDRIFVAGRPKAIYCSRTCSTRATTVAYRAKHAEEILDARHERHVRRQRARLGPKVKVGRRPPKTQGN